jgi:hypothetical protein
LTLTPPDPQLRISERRLVPRWFQPLHLSREKPVSKFTFQTQLAPLRDGELLLVENNELKATIPASPEGVSIDCIIPFGTKGFICGGDNGVLSIYERSEEKEMYKRTKSFSIENHNVRIKNLALSPSEENLICTLEDNQMYVLGLSNSDILKSEEMNFDLLSQGFHSQVGRRVVSRFEGCPLVSPAS